MAHAMVRFGFEGDTLDVVKDGGEVWVGVARVCEALGLEESAQRKRLQRKAWAQTAVMAVSTGIIEESGGERQSRVFCINLRSLPMWLATIDTERVAATARPKVELYQLKAHDVLADHFLGARGAPAVGLREAAVAIQQQAVRVGDHPVYLRTLALALYAVARASGLHFQTVHGQIRRTFKVPSYKHLLISNLDPALALLEGFSDGRLRLAGAPLRKTLPSAERQLVLFRGGA